MRRRSGTLLGEFSITPERSNYLQTWANDLEDWEGSYKTYYENEDIPKETQEEVKRIFDEIRTSYEEDRWVLGEEIKLVYPDMTSYEIDYGENKAYVYRN